MEEQKVTINENEGNNEVKNIEGSNVDNHDSSKKGIRKHIVLFVVIILLLAGLGFLIFKKVTTVKVEDLNSIPSVNVTHIRRGSVDKEISIMGNILPEDTYYVPAKVGGDLLKIYVENGDHVKKGDPICEIDASKEIEAAYIQYDTARSAYERMRKLYQAGDISRQNYESVKAQYDSAKLQYDTKVEYSVPVAVGDGIVENTNMTINTAVSAGTVLCYITSEEAKEINFGVTERILPGISIGDKVTIEKSGKTYDGYISNIASLINSSNGLFNVKATITTPNDFASGIMAKVTFVYESKKNVNVLPNDIVYYEGGYAYVYVVGNDNILKKEYIDVGIEDEYTSEILTNLDKSLRIVSTWNSSLADGTLVNVANDEEVYDEVDLENDVNKIINSKNNIDKQTEDAELKESIENVVETIKEELETTTEIVETDKAIEETTKKAKETTHAADNVVIPNIVPAENTVAPNTFSIPADVKITEVQ